MKRFLMGLWRVSIKEDGGIKIRYTDFVPEDRVDICMEFAQKIAKDLSSRIHKNSGFPNGLDSSWEIELTPSCTPQPATKGKVSASMSDARLAYAIGVRTMDWENAVGELLEDAGLGFGIIAR